MLPTCILCCSVVISAARGAKYTTEIDRLAKNYYYKIGCIIHLFF